MLLRFPPRVLRWRGVQPDVFGRMRMGAPSGPKTGQDRYQNFGKPQAHTDRYQTAQLKLRNCGAKVECTLRNEQ